MNTTQIRHQIVPNGAVNYLRDALWIFEVYIKKKPKRIFIPKFQFEDCVTESDYAALKAIGPEIIWWENNHIEISA